MCMFCEQKYNKPRTSFGGWIDNEIKIAGGGWTALFIAVNSHNQIVLRACGDDYTDDVLINYCPFCGAELNQNHDKPNNWFRVLHKQNPGLNTILYIENLDDVDRVIPQLIKDYEVTRATVDPDNRIITLE